MAFHSQDQDEGSVQMWHRKQKSALKPAHGTPLGHVSPVDGVRVGAPASPSTGGPVRREAGTYPGPGRKAAEGRMGGREHHRPALQGTSWLCPARYLLLAPPPAVGRGRRGGDLLSIHLDHALATRARRDGQQVRVKPEHLLEGLRGVGGRSAALPE
ncbi:hypothetical protein JEQ12_015072 [Ovis aries]|uniref:Uncharacterized protein n=1 Tax=Ovis aries TaxID=9940 RepID=A0A836ALC5_SHEEP|nr:hypothetical protein JEQ12_015072 [Ovis aries]